MKENADSRTALQIIGNFAMQAAARGDTAALRNHLLVYVSAVKASKEQAAQGRG